MSNEKKMFRIEGKQATLYCSPQPDKPLILLNNYAGDGEEVVKAMREIDAPDCNLLVVGNLMWDHDMTPWYCPPLSEKDTPYTGGADEYLNLLLTQIIPQARTMLQGKPRFTGIAGYSLAGLFALYAMYQCDAFDRVASMSGSLWFQGFKEYVMSHGLKKRPEKLYLSLGDKEAKTKNPYLKAVQDNTEQIVSHYEQMGLDVTWELNSGNHFKDVALRSAKGIKALLE